MCVGGGSWLVTYLISMAIGNTATTTTTLPFSSLLSPPHPFTDARKKLGRRLLCKLLFPFSSSSPYLERRTDRVGMAFHKGRRDSRSFEDNYRRYGYGMKRLCFFLAFILMCTTYTVYLWQKLPNHLLISLIQATPSPSSRKPRGKLMIPPRPLLEKNTSP